MAWQHREEALGGDKLAAHKFSTGFFKFTIYLFLPNCLSRTVQYFKSLSRKKKRKTNTNLTNNRTTGMVIENTTIGPCLTRTPREETGEEETREKADN